MSQGASNQQVTAIELEAPTVEEVQRRTTPVRIPGPDRIEIEEYLATEPKRSFLLKLGKLATGSEAEQMSLIDEFLDKVFTEEDANRLRHRMDDADDWFDVDPYLTNVLEQLEGLWSNRPTTSRGASGGPRRSPGRRSTARAH